MVTANKALLAASGVELAKIAEERGVLLNFEAAVAGGIPVIKALRESLTGNTVSRVYGIMNGTCNYILTRMEKEGLSFADCLKEAQRLGYAEADPTFDIEGNDTAHKLAILTTLAFGTQLAPEEIYLEGISNISIEDIHAAADLGYRIKLLGVALRTETGIEQRVHPTMVPRDSVIAQVDGVTNAVAIESDILGELLMVGPARRQCNGLVRSRRYRDIAKSRPAPSRCRFSARRLSRFSRTNRQKCRATRAVISSVSRLPIAPASSLRSPPAWQKTASRSNRSSSAPGRIAAMVLPKGERRPSSSSPMRRWRFLSARLSMRSRRKAISLASRRSSGSSVRRTSETV